jgi:hypothetical protein
LAAQSNLLGDLRNAHRFLAQHLANGLELLTGVAGFSAEVGAVVILLGVLDSDPLSGLGSFSLRLGRWRP